MGWERDNQSRNRFIEGPGFRIRVVFTGSLWAVTLRNHESHRTGIVRVCGSARDAWECARAFLAVLQSWHMPVELELLEWPDSTGPGFAG